MDDIRRSGRWPRNPASHIRHPVINTELQSAPARKLRFQKDTVSWIEAFVFPAALIHLPFRRKGKAHRKPGFKRFLRFRTRAAPRHNRDGGHTDDGLGCCSHDVENWVGENRTVSVVS